MPLDQVVVSYWFNGPADWEDPAAAAPQQGAAAAELAAAQFRLTCSDATPAVGAWRGAGGSPGLGRNQSRLVAWKALCPAPITPRASAQCCK